MIEGKSRLTEALRRFSSYGPKVQACRIFEVPECRGRRPCTLEKKTQRSSVKFSPRIVREASRVVNMVTRDSASKQIVCPGTSGPHGPWKRASGGPIQRSRKRCNNEDTPGAIASSDVRCAHEIGGTMTAQYMHSPRRRLPTKLQGGPLALRELEPSATGFLPKANREITLVLILPTIAEGSPGTTFPFGPCERRGSKVPRVKPVTLPRRIDVPSSLTWEEKVL
ncbi:hypothetical protein KM043_006561 [Ampulex compressa]|nr:hypothetical protein KM043_006561 [Ampulex compressa]